MEETKRAYIAIDLKSFYASVECVERGLNPLSNHLVVADESRTSKTICLAVTPSLKEYGTGGRPRLFEVEQRIQAANAQRQAAMGKRPFAGKSYDKTDLEQHKDWEIDFIRAKPRMALYVDYSARIFRIYLKYIAPEDIHVYSIDEVFMDVTSYLRSYRMTPHQLAITIIRDVLKETGITATAGIGTNLYLAKVAMDIVAKHQAADEDGVRIAELDEMSYRQRLWQHQPLTDFWRVGRGIAERLALYGVHNMGQLARLSLEREGLLYQLFGVNAEILIDHAWGWEPCTMEMVKTYRPEIRSMGSGQVLNEPYTVAKARVVTLEMAEALALRLFEHGLVAHQLMVTIGYDRQSLTIPSIAKGYNGRKVLDHYGRAIPVHAHGSVQLPHPTASISLISAAVSKIFDQEVHPLLLVRRINIVAGNVVYEDSLRPCDPIQLNLFEDPEQQVQQQVQKVKKEARERKLQQTILSIKNTFGKNAILRGLNFQEGATARERNQQIGGHKA